MTLFCFAHCIENIRFEYSEIASKNYTFKTQSFKRKATLFEVAFLLHLSIKKSRTLECPDSWLEWSSKEGRRNLGLWCIADDFEVGGDKFVDFFPRRIEAKRRQLAWCACELRRHCFAMRVVDVRVIERNH